jgi:hypothetical protein
MWGLRQFPDGLLLAGKGVRDFLAIFSLAWTVVRLALEADGISIRLRHEQLVRAPAPLIRFLQRRARDRLLLLGIRRRGPVDLLTNLVQGLFDEAIYSFPGRRGVSGVCCHDAAVLAGPCR